MLNTIRSILLVLVAIAAIPTILSFMGPQTSQLNRTVNIDASKDAVFPYIKSLKEIDRWSPWSKSDPTNKNVWEGEDGTVGSKMSWVGEKTGVGSQTITRIEEGITVETFLDFKEPYESQAKAMITLSDGTDGGTDVTWGFNSENGFVERLIFLFSPLEDALAPQYEEGLALLKELVESELSKTEVISESAEITVEE